MLRQQRCFSLKKSRCSYAGSKGGLILESHRAEVIPLIEETHDNGARYYIACEVVSISQRFRIAYPKVKRRNECPVLQTHWDAASRAWQELWYILSYSN